MDEFDVIVIGAGPAGEVAATGSCRGWASTASS
jgi:flavin-dependent dehydrogenase